MIKLFLAAGVAALALTAPVYAGPHGGGNGGGRGGVAPGAGGGPRAFPMRSGGGPRAVPMLGGGGAPRGQTFAAPRGGERAQPMRANRGNRANSMPQIERRAPRVADFNRGQTRATRMDMRVPHREAARPVRIEHADRREQRMAARPDRREQRVAARPNRREQRAMTRPNQVERMQSRMANREQMREHRIAERQQLRSGRVQQTQDRLAEGQQIRAERMQQIQNRMAGPNHIAANRFAQVQAANTPFTKPYFNPGGRGLINGCPPGLFAKNNGCLPPSQAAKLIGAPVATAASMVALRALPTSVQYLYPDTNAYYYRYGDGYLYQVDRSTNVIDSLISLFAGGYLPGQYLPASYMSSYVPNYYGFNSFYPDTPTLCNRYGNGVVYEVDCATGMIDGVVPLYASGYGVGQMLPSAYGYYNVPDQYRNLYYDTADTGYWYAPGAIYQYDPTTSLITSVAALLSPGFTIGQPLPAGYGTYNVPLAYRSTYYDTPSAWYRYNNGYIYQVDPVTQLVTSILASALT